LAREKALDRLVAVKVLDPDLSRESVARSRFEREAKAAATLDHPNVVSVYRFGYLGNGAPYLVMQYVHGGTLADRIEAEGPVSLRVGKQILSQVADALAAAHKHGFLHRDVKPGNVLCDNELGRYLLSDFGMAGVLPTGTQADPRLTKTGEVIGTPRYMSPEQMSGRQLTEASDIYSLGILGYEILTGEGPFAESSLAELHVAQARSSPRPIQTLRPDIDPKLAKLLEKCLSRDPAMRPSAAFLSKAIREVGGGGNGGQIVGDTGVLQSLLRRKLPQVVAVTAGVGWLLLQFTDQLVQQGLLIPETYRLALNTWIAATAVSAVVSWFHGESGRQRVVAVEVLLLVLVVVVWVLACLSVL